LIEIKK